ncbi:MAG TPA: PilZ domain-containing protein [Thermomicrobiales bacterium]|nr:PilZ domain-containing protein [Thermomicrobiales bacterium]
MRDWQRGNEELPAAGPFDQTDAARTAGGSTTRGDRRRTARFLPKRSIDVALSTVMDFTVVDLSATGVLLSCAWPLDIGHRRKLQMVIAGRPFAAWIEVRRVEQFSASAGAPPGYLVGASFLSIDESSQDTLQRFIANQRRRLAARRRED